MRKSSWVGFGLAVLAAPYVAAGPGFWTSTGPYGGRVVAMEIDPTSSATIYISSRGGVFKSIDGGASWNRAQNGLAGSGTGEPRLLMDRDRPTRLYLVDASGRLMRTTDGAANWSSTGFNLAAPGTSIGAVDYADVPTSARNGQFYIAAAAGSTTTGTGGGIYRTTDDGATFTRLGGGLPGPTVNMRVVEVDPTNPDRVLAGIDFFQGPAGTVPPAPLWRSTDGGATWSPVIAAPPTTAGQPVFVSAVEDLSFGAGSQVYAVYEGAIYRSSDDGATWSQVPPSAFVPLGVDSVVAHPTIAGTVFVGSPIGFYTITGTDGATPTLSAPSTTLTPNAGFTDSSAPPRPIQTSAQRVVLAPDFPAAGSSIWVLTEYAGLFRSIDGGANFSSFDVNNGLLATNPRAVVVHPTATPTRIYAGLGDSNTVTPALWRSNDSGVTWPVANSGLRAGQVRALAIDPTTTTTLAGTVVYAGGRGVLTGPQPSPPGNQFSGRNGGIYKSTNGGGTWTTIDATLPTSTSGGVTFANVGLVRSIALDPRSCASGPPPGPTGAPCTASTGPLQKILAAAGGFLAATPGTGGAPATRQFTHRVLLSTNAGATWSDTGTTLPAAINQLIDPDGPGPGAGFNNLAEFITPVPLVIDPSNSNVIYLGTFLQRSWQLPDGSDFADPQPAPTLRNGVFKSEDGGATWTHRSIGLPLYTGSTVAAHDVLALGISGRNPQLLWAATAVNAVDRLNTSLYRSTDGGLTWSESRSGIAPGLDIRAITVNTPSDPGLAEAVYIAGAGTAANPGAVYRSTDGGVTWVSISIGLPADAALAITTDPRVRARVLAGTNLGVWEITQQSDLDGDGAPDAQEGNAPNGGDGNGDGQPDSIQGDVGSTIVLFNEPSRRGFLACDGQFTTEIINDAQCPQARDVQQVDAADLPADPVPGGSGRAYRLPLDAVRFEIPQCQQATVEVTFHQAGFLPGVCPDFNDYQWSFRFFGPQVPGDNGTIGWYDLGNRATRVGPKKWRLTLDAGQFGSYRPNDPANPSNNAILFIGAPALSGDRILRSSFEPGEN